MIKLLTWYLDPIIGKILVDGYDIGLIDVKKLRSEIFVLSQELALFQGTILENLNPCYI